jgi:5-methylcytosine-specific restriction endonuclease McrA
VRYKIQSSIPPPLPLDWLVANRTRFGRGTAFHLGPTRSGCVGTAGPCFGRRSSSATGSRAAPLRTSSTRSCSAARPRSPAPPLRPGLTPRGPRPRRSPPAPTTRASLARPRGSSCPIRGGTDRSSRHAHARDPLGCSTRGIGAEALAEEQSVSLLRFCLHCYTHHQGCCPKADSRRNLEPSKRARNTQRYREAKQAARRRDGERCTRCGSGDRLEVHHIVPLSEGGDAFALSNLTTLCHDCHRMTYGGWESIEGRRRKHPAPRFSRKTLSNRGAPSEKSNVGPDKRLRALSWLTRPFELVRRPNNVDISLRL